MYYSHPVGLFPSDRATVRLQFGVVAGPGELLAAAGHVGVALAAKIVPFRLYVTFCLLYGL